MKRVSRDFRPSRFADEAARSRIKHQNLLQEYLELQKEVVTRKKKLQAMRQRKEIILDEVRFLRRRHRYLTELKELETKQGNPALQLQEAPSKMLGKGRSNGVSEAISKKQYPLLDSNPSLCGEEEEDGGSKEKAVKEPQREEKKLKNRLSTGKKVVKKKITWQDPVAIKV